MRKAPFACIRKQNEGIWEAQWVWEGQTRNAVNSNIKNRTQNRNPQQDATTLSIRLRSDFDCNSLQWKSIADPVIQIGKVVGEPVFFCVARAIGGDTHFHCAACPTLHYPNTRPCQKLQNPREMKHISDMYPRGWVG